MNEDTLCFCHSVRMQNNANILFCGYNNITCVDKRLFYSPFASGVFAPQCVIVRRNRCMENRGALSSSGLAKLARSPGCHVSITDELVPIKTCLLQSHLTWERLLIESIPIADKSQMWVDFFDQWKSEKSQVVTKSAPV